MSKLKEQKKNHSIKYSDENEYIFEIWIKSFGAKKGIICAMNDFTYIFLVAELSTEEAGWGPITNKFIYSI